MGNSVEPLRRSGGLRAVAKVALALVVGGFVAALLAGPSAHATSRPADQLPLRSDCTPPTNPYGSSTTIADCGTSTTEAPATVSLTVRYDSGVVEWRSCVSSSASGSTVQLYINGSLEDSSQIESNGCTPQKDLALCLQPGDYNATAVDQPYGQASEVFRVRDSGCASPVALAATAQVEGSQGSASGHTGGLAFTGADIALLAIAAGALMIVGMFIVRMTRQRKSAG